MRHHLFQRYRWLYGVVRAKYSHGGGGLPERSVQYLRQYYRILRCLQGIYAMQVNQVRANRKHLYEENYYEAFVRIFEILDFSV